VTPRHPSTGDKLNAAQQRRDTAQGILARCLRELNLTSGQRYDDALTLCCRLLWDIDGISSEIEILREQQALENDPDRMA
jgi:hypothetical protein